MKKETKNGVWVLTREVNAYDQEGAYFVAVFETKPTIEQLVTFFKDHNLKSYGDALELLQFFVRLENGGGRFDNADEWYNLNFVPFAVQQ